MTGFDRYAIYWAPEPGAFADATARWLGWDPIRAEDRPHPDFAGLPRSLSDITATPRKYGFHGTVKAPFRLLPGQDSTALHRAAQDLCDGLAPVVLSGLAVRRLEGFVALTPEGDQSALSQMAARVVAGLDRFRAPPTGAEIARRHPEGLSQSQRQNLARWGYPFVMEDFQFHLTLTGDLPGDEAQQVANLAGPFLAPFLPRPFVIDSLCLSGQGRDGRFRLLHRYSLSG